MPVTDTKDSRYTVKSLPDDAELVLKVIPMPADCNQSGDIFGGWVMAQVDLAGAVLPARYVNGRIATVAVNEFIFKQSLSMRAAEHFRLNCYDSLILKSF